MANGFEISLELEESVSTALGRAIIAGTDMTPAMKSIAAHLSTSAQLRFEAEAGPGGKPWKPSQRVIDKPEEKTLNLHGHLKGSLREAWGPDFAAAGPEASGPAAIYAKIHQLGGVILPKVKKALSFGGRIFARIVMPARPYLGFDPEDPAIIGEIIGNHLRDAFAGRGGAA